ncbi:MAG: BACON domain-containing protein [Bacteroidales bacterium]|nr:BACON domain-containing protein [Bacteroidales bacterium]
MRFFKNLYRSALVAVAGVLALASCQPEESPLARAIMTSVSGLQFDATGAEPQTITVYSDADWTVEAPEWVTVDVVNGTRTMDVTVSVGDNLRDGALDNPKKDTIVFKGYNLLATAYVIVSQDGDKYRDVVPATISEVLSMKDEEVVVLDDVAVVALSSDGFVVNDGNESVFVSCTEPVTVGDCVDVRGSKGTMNGVPAVTICDDLKIERNFAVVYPLVNDITATIDTYAPSKLEYVELAGSLDGVNVLVEGATKVGALLAHSSVDLAALNGHNLIVRGFSFGATASLVNIIPVEIEDLGVNEIIYFTDNFDWVAELADAAGAGDSMGVDGDDSAKNAYTSVEGFAELLASQGYEDLFPSSKTIYLQKNYLKFSKGSNVNGIRFPAVAYGGTTNVVLTFDWGVHVGSGGQDETELMIEIEGNGAVDRETFTHTAGEWVWQTETVTISGIDDNSRIVLKPTTFVGEVSSGYYRWYLDNIKIVQGEGEAPVPGPGAGGKTVYSDDFEWFADLATTEGAGDAVGTNDPGTTAPNVWKMNSSADFFARFNERGYQYLYGTVGATEFAAGPAQEPNSGVGKEGSLYLQSNYLKFGQSSYNGALVLPALSAIEGTADVVIEFDWCWHLTGGMKPDLMTVSVDATVGQFPTSGAGTSLDIESAQPTEGDLSELAWQHVTLELNGATAETVLTIRPTNADPSIQNAARSQNRWYLDNIKVTTK